MLTAFPASKGLTYWWNGGRMLGIILVVQILTGFLLVFFYANTIFAAFDSVDFMARETNYGWILRIIHLNGASMFFLFIYLHFVRGLLLGSYKLTYVWLSGLTILLLLMATAFLGYVLPWGQMRFWGATVITNLVSAIPILGPTLVVWLWGGFNVGNATLGFFFALHYLVPFVILALVVVHLLFLHETGRRNYLGDLTAGTKTQFHPYYTFKDAMNLVLLSIMIIMMLFTPWVLGDPENWIEANPMSSPLHIKPEWYFLFAYAILRAIPNKLGGVLALVVRVTGFYFLVLFNGIKESKPYSYMMVSWFILVAGTLTWLGGAPVEDPFLVLRQWFSALYFIMIFMLPLVSVTSID